MFNIKKYNEINKFLKKTSNSAKIVAISKNHPVERILEAINYGVNIFGEIESKKRKINLLKSNKTIQISNFILQDRFNLIRSKVQSSFLTYFIRLIEKK